jgi:hypothetical protein
MIVQMGQTHYLRWGVKNEPLRANAEIADLFGPTPDASLCR